jgi:hypothetical protein
MLNYKYLHGITITNPLQNSIEFFLKNRNLFLTFTAIREASQSFSFRVHASAVIGVHCCCGKLMRK